MWTIDSGTVDLVAGTSVYDLPADTIDLIEQSIRTGNGDIATQSDLTCSRISVSTYSGIPNKLTQGRPIQVWIDRLRDAPRINLWPVPDASSTYTFVYYRLRRIQDAGSGVETADANFRFLPALVSGLAYYIAMKIPEFVTRLPVLQAEYESQFTKASGEDREKASITITPRVARI